MKSLFKDLADTGIVFVTGSYADGTATEESDIDFYVKEDKPDSQTRNFVKVLNVLKQHNIKWDSHITGYVFTHKTPNTLDRQLEFSDLYRHRPNRLKEVYLDGVRFRTW